MNNHAAMIASLTNGTVSVKTGKETLRFRISGGFVEVLNNVLSVLVEGAEEV